jgi:citrate lyase subunit beta/citryl-CoA lyase
MRSFLFVPGDSPRKIEKALTSGADALILDLEDSVAPAAKHEARRIVAEALAAAHGAMSGPKLFVRINALDTPDAEPDLDAVVPAAPHGIVLPKARAGADVMHLGAKLAVREAENGVPDGATRILAIATETAASIFTMGTYAGASRRLVGLAWGAEDLSADLGAEANRTPDGTYADPYRLARTLTIYAAAAAEVAGVDTVYVDYRNEAGLTAECEAGRRDGFSAKLAIHPAQVPVINAVFTPTPEAIAEARAVVEAFRADPEAGVIGIGGKMYDRPHLRRAERVLARAAGA